MGGCLAVNYYDFRNSASEEGATTPAGAFIVHSHKQLSPTIGER